MRTPLSTPKVTCNPLDNAYVGNNVGMIKAGGNWVVGEQFFDRETELAALAERVQAGTHTLLTAQRRMGKTRRS